ncbi:7811_t:CDS:2, partial [Scutellospora calospora]
MPSQFFSNLSQDLSQLLDNADDYNVSIQVGEGSSIKEFRAHSNILMARSPYFKRALSSDWVVKKDNNIIFNKPNVSPMVFAMMLKYIYTGILDLDKQSGPDILGLLVASDELLLDELIVHCQEHLIEEKANWLRLNFVQVLQTVIKLKSCKKLQDHCLKTICQDPQPFFSSKIFSSLDRDILYGLLEREDLEIDEIEVWEHLIKWGIAQNVNSNDAKMPSDVNKWTDKHFIALKKSVEQFIPLIRLFEISSKDFYYKVRPYKKILPQNIYEDLMSHYLADTEPKTITNLAPRMGHWQIDSVIIKPKHAVIIANWINRVDGKLENKILPERSRSSLSIETVAEVSQHLEDINEPEEYDNELTLTADSELYKAVTNAHLYAEAFKKGLPDEPSQNNNNDNRPSEDPPKLTPRFSDIWYKLLKPIFVGISAKATWPMAKQVLKAAVAYWLAFVIDLIVPAMQELGSFTFLAIVMVCYFQPSRTFGSLWQSAGWGIVGACLATLWSFLGITISQAIRGDKIFSIPAMLVNLSFLAIGTFILSYDKIKWQPMRYGAINAIMIMSFSLTQSYVNPGKTNKILKSLLIPMLIGPACSFVVNITLWPENATTNYIPCLHKTLQSFIDLLEQETNFFLRGPYNRNTISQLNRIAHDNILNLDIAKKDAQHEVSYSKIGPEDLLDINKIVKSLHMILEGLALSGVIEEELMKDRQEGTIEIRIEDKCDHVSIFDQVTLNTYTDDLPSPSSVGTATGCEEDLTKLLEIIRPICTELSEVCQMCLADSMIRVEHLKHNCREPWYKKIWPFCLKPTPSHNQNVIDDPIGHLHTAITKFENARVEGLNKLFEDKLIISPLPQRVLLLILLFENSLKTFAEDLCLLVATIKMLGSQRQSKKFWLPPIPFFKRTRDVGGTEEECEKFFESNTRQDEKEEIENEILFDPDVTPPTTSCQRFWYKLWMIRNWFNSIYAKFAIKNTLVVTALCLPAFLPYSYVWFNKYHGQWALISAVVSFSPTTGGAVLQFFGRLIGSIVGASMAIIAWKITDGNSYVWTVGGVIMLVNFALVLANVYQSQYGMSSTQESIIGIAINRTCAVGVGITSVFFMNLIPWPHTGRVEVRRRLARTMSDICVLYSITISSLLKDNLTAFSRTRSFRKLLSKIKRSIAIERLLLSRTKYEPPLRGNFPIKRYEEIIEIVEHMVCLVGGLDHILHELNGTEWKTELADVFNPTKCHYITHILTTFHILSTALENKVPLPPYNIIASGDTRYGKVGLGSKISGKIRRIASDLTKEDLETHAFICY